MHAGSKLGNVGDHGYDGSVLESVLSDSESLALPVSGNGSGDIQDRHRVIVARSDGCNEVRCARSRSGHSASKAAQARVSVCAKSCVALVSCRDKADFRGIGDPVNKVKIGASVNSEDMSDPGLLQELGNDV